MTMDETADHVTAPGEKQREFAHAMVRGGRSLTELMEAYGISEDEFLGWVLDGTFTEYAASLARGYAEADAPYVWNDLLDLTHNGNVPAIRLYFDIMTKKQTGRSAERAAGAEISGLRESIFADAPEGGTA